MVRGRFITLEGGEGTGKSTQAGRLAAFLRERGHDVVATREPGGAPGAEDIRRLLVSGETDRWSAVGELLLLNAARDDHLRTTIRPALTAAPGWSATASPIPPALTRAWSAAWMPDWSPSWNRPWSPTLFPISP